MIDFPQVVSPEGNPAAWSVFRRDVARVCEYFAAQDVKTDAHKLAMELWTAHGYRVTMPVDPHHLDADDPAHHQAWERLR